MSGPRMEPDGSKVRPGLRPSDHADGLIALQAAWREIAAGSNNELVDRVLELLLGHHANNLAGDLT